MNELIAWPMDEKEYTASGLGAAYSARSRGILRGTDFAATANGNLTVTVGVGLGCLHVNDFWAIFPVCSTSQTLTFTDSDGSLDRIDIIALRLDKNGNVAGLDVIKGSPAQTPVYPTMHRDDDDYDEIFLYAVYRTAGTTEITAADITDLRLNETYCGLMKSELDSIDTSVLQAQLDAFIEQNETSFADWRYLQEQAFSDWRRGQESAFENWEQNQEDSFESWSNDQKATFIAWVDTIRDILDETTAGHLQNEIDSAEIDDILDHGFPSAIIVVNGSTITETEQVSQGGLVVDGRQVITTTSQVGAIKTITSILYSSHGSEIARSVTTVNGNTITTQKTVA